VEGVLFRGKNDIRSQSEYTSIALLNSKTSNPSDMRPNISMTIKDAPKRTQTGFSPEDAIKRMQQSFLSSPTLQGGMQPRTPFKNDQSIPTLTPWPGVVPSQSGAVNRLDRKVPPVTFSPTTTSEAPPSRPPNQTSTTTLGRCTKCVGSRWCSPECRQKYISEKQNGGSGRGIITSTYLDNKPFALWNGGRPRPGPRSDGRLTFTLAAATDDKCVLWDFGDRETVVDGVEQFCYLDILFYPSAKEVPIRTGWGAATPYSGRDDEYPPESLAPEQNEERSSAGSVGLSPAEPQVKATLAISSDESQSGDAVEAALQKGRIPEGMMLDGGEEDEIVIDIAIDEKELSVPKKRRFGICPHGLRVRRCDTCNLNRCKHGRYRSPLKTECTVCADERCPHHIPLSACTVCHRRMRNEKLKLDGLKW